MRGCLSLNRIIAACAPIIMFVVPANAQNLRELQITYQDGGRTKTKNIFCDGNTPGNARTKRGQLTFTSFSASIKTLKRKSPPSKKLPLYRTLNKAGKKACKGDSGGFNPQPTPTPSPSLGNFDSAGNVTSQGKATFGIPSNLSGNISQGKSIVQAYCTGCHVERIGYSFPVLRESIKQSPMLFDEEQIPDSMLANITAYLNRFRVN